MDQQQQQQVNEAAEKFAEAVRESYQTVADRAVSAQQLNAELTQNFFNSVISNLRSQAGHTGSDAGVGGCLHGLHKFNFLLLPGYRGAGRQAGSAGPETGPAVTRKKQ